MSNRTSVADPLKYSKFWHLEAIGLLKPSQGAQQPPTKAPEPTEVWGSITGPHKSIVAIIDTGVSAHPYLAGKVPAPKTTSSLRNAGQELDDQTEAEKSHNFDLTGAPTLQADKDTNAKLVADEDWPTWLADMELFPNSAAAGWQEDVKKLIDDNLNKISVNAGAPVTSNQQFSAHGTACAGLIAAHVQHYLDSRTGSRQQAFIPPFYSGVDPASEIVSITTSFAPRADLLTLAFVLAARSGADVILFPRGLPREIEFAVTDFEVENKDKPDSAKVLKAQKELARPWEALRQTIIAISRSIPIVCAVGNESEGKPIAPASFAADDNGIIAVGAMNYYGYRSSYSNFGGPRPDAEVAQGGDKFYKVTVAAPSDDAEIFNIDQARLDRTNRFIADHPYDYFVKQTGKLEIPFGEASIRSIDIPGAFGFSDTNSNVDAKIWIEPESYFTEFGGTSAAASIVAGVASLVQRAAKSRPDGIGLNGRQMRRLLHDSAWDKRSRHLPDDIKPDILGRDDIVNGTMLTVEQTFGNGLVDAAAAVKAALAGNY